MGHTPCQDPIFIYGTWYTNVEYETRRPSTVQSVVEREDGQMEITTRNTIYIADFSTQRVKQCFINQCKDRELL